MRAREIARAIGAALTLSTSALAQEGVALEKVTFEKGSQAATNIARKMYQPEFGYVSAQRIWLREPVPDATDQIAVKLGFGPNCQRDCRVAILYHTNGEWAEVWRGEGRELALGQVNEATGLKSIFSQNREWRWGGAKYEPALYGGYAPRRPASEAEMRIAVDWIKTQYPDAAITGEPPTIDALDVDLLNGGDALVFVSDLGICGNGPCPVLALENGKLLHAFSALGPDAGVGDGRRDDKGYRLIEIQTEQDVSVVSPSTGDVIEHIRPQEVIPAGTPREAAPQ